MRSLVQKSVLTAQRAVFFVATAWLIGPDQPASAIRTAAAFNSSLFRNWFVPFLIGTAGAGFSLQFSDNAFNGL